MNFYSILLLLVAYCGISPLMVFGMQKKSPLLVFVNVKEDPQKTKRTDMLVSEMNVVAKTSCIYIATNNIVHHLTKKNVPSGIASLSFQNQITVLSPSDADFTQEHLCIKKLKSTKLPIHINEKNYVQKPGSICQLIKTIFTHPLKNEEKKVFIFSGHGDAKHPCNMPQDRLIEILKHLNGIAKLVVVESCFFGNQKNLEAIASHQYAYPIIGACIGDTVSYFDPTTALPNLYQQSFDELNSLKHPILSTNIPTLLSALDRMLNFANRSNNICKILHPGNKSFEILAAHTSQNNDLAFIGNRTIVTEADVTTPVILTPNTTINFGTEHDTITVSHMAISNDEDLEMPSTPEEERLLLTNIAQKFSPSKRKRAVTIFVHQLETSRKKFKGVNFVVDAKRRLFVDDKNSDEPAED